MSQTLRNYIKSSWQAAYLGAPEDSFIASPIYYAKSEAPKSYPLCLVWSVRRLPTFTKSGYIDNRYRVTMYVVDKCEIDETYDAIQEKIDNLRPFVDKLLSSLNSGSVNGITGCMVTDVLHAMDDNCCGHEIVFDIAIDEDSQTIC